MKKMLSTLLITGVLGVAAAEANDGCHHRKHRKHRYAEEATYEETYDAACDECPACPNRPFYVGIDLGYSKSRIKFTPGLRDAWEPPTVKDSGRVALKSFAGNLRLGYMNNINYFLYGVEGGVGMLHGRVTKPIANIENKFNMDLVAKAGLKINRAATYGLMGPGYASFRVTSNPNSNQGKVNKKYFPLGLVLGAGAMYDVTRCISVRAEYRFTRYQGMTLRNISPASRMKPRVSYIFAGVLYRL